MTPCANVVLTINMSKNLKQKIKVVNLHIMRKKDNFQLLSIISYPLKGGKSVKGPCDREAKFCFRFLSGKNDL